MGKLTRLIRALPLQRGLRRIFDRDFYLRKYPDVASAGIDPLRHYLEYGAAEGRKPCPLFDPHYYLLRCPEARESAEPGVFHFLRGAGEQCPSPHPLFDCASYVRARPEAARVNPLAHYLSGPRASSPPGAFTLTVMDAEVAIAFADSAVVGAVSVWEDDSGRMRFLAPPEQAPFFAAVRYDQLRAQLGLG